MQRLLAVVTVEGITLSQQINLPSQTSSGRLGFSLIELIVAVAILGVVSSIGVLAYGNLSKSNRDTRRVADLNSVRQALELYRKDNWSYPQCLFDSCSLNPPPLENYMPILPIDPSSSYSYKYLVKPDNCTTDCTSYYLCAKNETGRNFGTTSFCQGQICGSSENCGIEVVSP